MIDVLNIETGNGGDFQANNGDLKTVSGFENMPYLAMFSGDGNWWGNDLLFIGQDASVRFASKTDQVFKTVTLTSAGRIKIEEAIIADLAFLQQNLPGTNVSVKTSITGPDRLEIYITIGGQDFAYSWNPDQGIKQLTV